MLFSFLIIFCASFVDKPKRFKHFHLEREQWISFLETMFTHVVWFFFSFFFFPSLGCAANKFNHTKHPKKKQTNKQKTHNISIQLALFFAEAPEGNWFGLRSKNSNNFAQQITELWLYGSKKTNWGADVWQPLWMHQSEQNGARLWMYFLYCLLCSPNSCVVACQQANMEDRGRQRGAEIVSWMNAVIFIKSLGVTAGHPQPSAARFCFKQDCLTWSVWHTHRDFSTQA